MKINGLTYLVLIVIFVVFFGEGKILSRKAKYQEDYDGDYEDYDTAHENYDATDEVESTSIPNFISMAESIMINEGDTIKMSCLVDKLDNLIILWKKGNKIIVLNGRLYEDDDDRIVVEKVPNGNILSIRLAEEDDAGEYTCQVSAAETIELVHNVEIRVSPEIQSIPRSGIIEVTAGKPVILSCKVTEGYPRPEIMWRRQDRPMPTGEDFISGLSIEFPATNRHHSGKYTCSADNGGSKVATAKIKLIVNHPPEIEQNKMLISNKEGNEVEITCTVHASPSATVEWFRDGTRLEPKENVISKRGNRHTLFLSGIVKVDQIGNYECKAKNRFGEATASTEVSTISHKVEIKSSAEGSDMTKYVLEWIVISDSEVTECIIKFKIDNEGKDWMFITANVKQVELKAYAGKVSLEHLTPGAKYIVQISTKSDTINSEFGETFLFSTKEHTTIEDLVYNQLSDTEYLKDYETEVEATDQLEESSGLDISMKESSGIEEDIIVSPDATDFLSETISIKEDIFLPVVNEEEINTSDVVESSGSVDLDTMPEIAIPRQLPNKSAEENSNNDATAELPVKEKSTSSANSLIISCMIVIGFISCKFI